MNIPVITIDGPSGSGKGTIGRLLAAKLGWVFLDSGMLYRALAYALLDHPEVNPDETASLLQLIKHLKVTFAIELFDIANPKHADQILFKDIDISDKMRSELCGQMASQIAAKPSVREALLAWQRSFRRAPGLVTDGRDMGTVVFPDATLKIFLTASAEERAKRRFQQLQESGINVSFDKLFQDLVDRDERDRKRSIAPLLPAADATILDTTKLSIEQVLAKIMEKL